MEEFCNCKDWDSVKDNSPFLYDKDYGWLITWIDLTNESNHTKVHRYGVSIGFCPMCGKKLKHLKEEVLYG